MSEQYADLIEGPLIPRPDANSASLRAAVGRIMPSWLPEFDGHHLEASTEAEKSEKIGPLQVFCRIWLQRIEIQRYPARAKLLADLERKVAEGHPDMREALSEISRLLAEVAEDLER
ncbi:hypothetical protein [Nocardiopsis sp. JB363]|uniref:hypothetical protein n=1 Tax=Nocardiopsis sp. JB363 TaxID=1434837 RepID=UPI00097A27CC|nr:hypothetical protein [Nocardiopsis sp. JB363]SIO89390.1 hypothetical protein BQ8420_21350 [Nocardiopsis sp. JB363]